MPHRQTPLYSWFINVIREHRHAKRQPSRHRSHHNVTSITNANERHAPNVAVVYARRTSSNQRHNRHNETSYSPMLFKTKRLPTPRHATAPLRCPSLMREALVTQAPPQPAQTTQPGNQETIWFRRYYICRGPSRAKQQQHRSNCDNDVATHANSNVQRYIRIQPSTASKYR
jgi:hypothetical protein